VLGEAGLAAHDAQPRLRQPEARRRHPVGGHLGAGQGSRRHGPHPDRQAVPDRVRMRLAHAARMAFAQLAITSMTRAGRRTAASQGAKWSGV
jgi:hypothetical protein